MAKHIRHRCLLSRLIPLRRPERSTRKSPRRAEQENESVHQARMAIYLRGTSPGGVGAPFEAIIARIGPKTGATPMTSPSIISAMSLVRDGVCVGRTVSMPVMTK